MREIASMNATTAAASITARYRAYVLVILFAACTLSFLDRQIIVILSEPIKHDFHLRDWQLGALSGLAFALFYSALSVPVARIADRGRRSLVITLSLGVWSLFTILCGVAQTYLQLATARMMVGVGEAGGSAPAQSLIADYTPPEKRASAMGIYLIGIPFGTLLGLVIGGVVAGRYGWRAAFFVAGVPGVALALLTALTLKEPHRHSISPADNNTRAALREIFSKPTFILMMIGGALVSFINYGQGAFFPSFFLRNHAGDLARMADLINHFLGTHLTPLAALGTVYGLCTGISGIASVLLGGYLTDRFARRDMRAYITIQVITGSLRIPCLFVAMFAGDAVLALAAITTRSFMQGLGGAAAYAAIPGLVRPAYRSTAIAIWSLALNAIGLGLGPLCVGVLSDSFAPSYGAAVGLKWALLCSEVVLAVAMMVVWGARRSFVRDTVS